MDKEFSNIRIVDIAKMAGVSLSVRWIESFIIVDGYLKKTGKKCRLFWRWLITSLIS